ncbi:MAG: hypothetical protein K0S45_985 [Nitrospira sp.]|jgi:hypothetical protein|nr:hypothetical protein [Nitrospira sp.]
MMAGEAFMRGTFHGLVTWTESRLRYSDAIWLDQEEVTDRRQGAFSCRHAPLVQTTFRFFVHL